MGPPTPVPQGCQAGTLQCPEGAKHEREENALGRKTPWGEGDPQHQALKGRHNWSIHAMSQSLVNNLLHLVYSTKNRQPWILKEHRDGLFAYQAGIFKEWDSPALLIGGVADHVHALFSLSKNHALEKIV